MCSKSLLLGDGSYLTLGQQHRSLQSPVVSFGEQQICFRPTASRETKCPLPLHEDSVSILKSPVLPKVGELTADSERAHLPNRMWEKIRLPSNYQKALAMIDERLMYVLKVNPIYRAQQLANYELAGTGRSSLNTRQNNVLPVLPKLRFA